VGGRLADIYGRRRIFRTGLIAYAVLAGLAAMAPNGAVLVAARGLQGVAGALLVPTTLALINSVYPPEERGGAIGTWAAWSGITTVLGPVIGGMIIDNASWRYALLITPVLAVGTFLLSGPVPESHDRSASTHLDYPGVVLVASSVGGVVFALVQGPVAGWWSPWVVAAAVIGVVFAPAFVWWERRAKNPVMPLGMFSDRNLTLANAVTFFVYAGLYGMFFYIPLYIQSALGISATVSGLAFVPVTVLLFFLSPYAGRLNDRFGPRWLMCAGPLVASVGVVIAGFTGPGRLWTVLLSGVVLFGVGLGFTVTPVTATAIGAAEQRYSGVASGFNNAVSRLAGMVAIALMGAIVISLWQSSLATVGSAAEPEVTSALESVRDKAFVIPNTESLSAEQAAETRQRATDAAGTAFRNGMMLAALLVATGGVVSGVWVRDGER
jgi:EmrB/QacA subfamily drug resistance transporter